MVRFFVGVALLIALVMALVAVEGGSILSLFKGSAFIIMVLVPLFASTAVWKPAAIGRSFTDALSSRADATTLKRSLRIWRFYQTLFAAAGVLCFFLGLVVILSTLSEVDGLTHAFAALTTALIYAAFFMLVARIMEERIAQKLRLGGE